MPLLIAAHPELTIKYKVMAAMDPNGTMTPSGLKHKLRKWKADAKIIAEEYTKKDHSANKNTGQTGMKKRTRSDVEEQGVEDTVKPKKARKIKPAPKLTPEPSSPGGKVEIGQYDGANGDSDVEAGE